MINNPLTRPSVVLSILFLIALVSPVVAVRAEPVTIDGFVNTLSCAQEGTICPIDRLDPHVALARDFVLQEKQVAGEYYFLANLPRETKARYVLEQVQVKGDLNRRYNTIQVDELRVKRGGKYKTVWSEAMMREELKRQMEGISVHEAFRPKD